MDNFKPRQIIMALCTIGLLSVSAQTWAAAFQLWEQDGASVGSYHAGYAAEANDASTAFYNPAGLTRFRNQEIVFAGVGVRTNFKFKGTVNLNPQYGGLPQATTAQGGNFGFLPVLHYVTPMTDNLDFGFSVDVPFGLKTNYGSSSIVRYAATQASVTVVDVSPSFGYKITDKMSLGLGLDIQRMFAEFDQMSSTDLAAPYFDTLSSNKANDTAYGYHAGLLYEFCENARVGLSYHSQVVHHLTGTSQFTGPLANAVSPNGGPYSSHATANVTLPGYAALSGFYKVHPRVALMASANYTQWTTFKTLSLSGLSGIQGFVQDQAIQVSLPQYYRNTWNVSVGTNFYATDKVMLRAGAGYDETPTKDAYRNVGIPDNNRYVVALGGHAKVTKTVGLDIGWLHVFAKQAHINPPPQVTGDQVVVTNGTVDGSANVYSAQVTWDMV